MFCSATNRIFPGQPGCCLPCKGIPVLWSWFSPAQVVLALPNPRLASWVVEPRRTGLRPAHFTKVILYIYICGHPIDGLWSQPSKSHYNQYDNYRPAVPCVQLTCQGCSHAASRPHARPPKPDKIWFSKLLLERMVRIVQSPSIFGLPPAPVGRCKGATLSHRTVLAGPYF